jgi:Mrp family chromosome partitioning ATPase
MSADNKKEPSSSCGSTACSGAGQSDQSQFQDQNIKVTLANIRHKLMVMSGKGGVGKSSVSAGLAVQLAQRGYSVGLLDVDIHGPSLAGIMGVEGLLETTEGNKALPKQVGPHLGVVSMQSLMPERDSAVIWRGPAKTGVIRQFMGEVQWGDLDFLVIDAPPGTGDEPLSVAQTIPEARALIVTTPQQVALADVRKSINFCRAVNLNICGLVENMGPFDCPCCGRRVDLFKSGGGQAVSDQMGIAFLGTLPFDPQVVKACDHGKPLEFEKQAPAFTAALGKIVAGLLENIGE